MKKHFRIITALLFIVGIGHAQWTLKLTSNVYLRTWKLDTKASKEEKEVDGATVTLFQGGKQIGQTTSSGGGEFTIMVPNDGEFYLTVSYPGCNTKRMGINTQNVPEKMSKDNFKPSFEITGGFIMVKPYPGIDYSQLSKDLIRVEYAPGKKAFDDTEAGTEQGLGIVSKIYAAEDELFSRFCSTNKAGDVALAKPDCPLAKTLYEKAIAMISGEQYPVVQLAKVGLCLKDKEIAEKKAADEAAAKAAASNVKKEDADKKAIADAIAKANEEKAKQLKEQEEKLAQANKEKAKKEEAENAKTAKQKAAEEKTKPKETKTATQTAIAEQPKEKKSDIKIKQKSPEQIEKEAEDAKKREGLAKSQAEDREAIAKDAAEAKAKYEEKQKAAREKEQKQKEGLAKSKAEDAAAMKESEAKKAAKQKEHEEKQKEGMAKSKAEDDAAIKADAEKKAQKQAERDAEEKEKKRLAYETKSKDSEGEMGKGNSDHSIPQVIGGAEKYRERIKAADELFKRKRYDEAKDIYNEALMYKEKDPYAISKLAEIEKLKAPK
ncbi:MAG: hypothetical protein H0W73_14525 [Bacteroidetes bacterium]|nr:hypothetical protein [Bacteroidota bacterium]